MEHPNRTGGGRRRTKGLQAIFAGTLIESCDHRDAIAGQLTQNVAQQRVGEVVIEDRIGYRNVELNCGKTPRIGVQPRIWGPTGQGTANVHEVAVPVGASTKNRIGEDDRVRLPPGDLLTERWSITELVRSTGPGRPASKSDVMVHEASH